MLLQNRNLLFLSMLNEVAPRTQLSAPLRVWRLKSILGLKHSPLFDFDSIQLDLQGKKGSFEAFQLELLLR